MGTPIRSTAARNLPTLSVEASSSRAPGQIFLRSAQSSLPPESAACRSLSEASDGVGRGTSGNTPRSHPTASARRLAGSDAALGVRMDMEREVKRRCGDGH